MSKDHHRLTVCCHQCGKHFSVKPSRLAYRPVRFCGRDCRSLFAAAQTASRFWSRVEKGPECWPWKGQIGPQGYGVIWAHGKYIRAHRFAYEDVCGPVPSGTCVLHRCDNPGCVRPDHLFLGSHRDNTDDKVRKGRHSRGRSVHTAKLTEDQVLEIRALYATGDTSLSRLGAAYGVDHTVVCDIVHRRSWKHV